jgi:hypothetical protein
MRFIYKILLDEKEKKKEGWDAEGMGRWQKCQQAWLADPP